MRTHPPCALPGAGEKAAAALRLPYRRRWHGCQQHWPQHPSREAAALSAGGASEAKVLLPTLQCKNPSPTQPAHAHALLTLAARAPGSGRHSRLPRRRRGLRCAISRLPGAAWRSDSQQAQQEAGLFEAGA